MTHDEPSHDPFIPEHAEERVVEALAESEATSHRHEEAGTAPSSTLWGDAWRRLRRNRLALIALVWISIVIVVSLTAGLWVPNVLGSPTQIDSQAAMQNRLQPPSLAHPMGTDDFGRDMLARVIYGARVSLAVGILSVALGLIIGVIFGSLAAYYGKALDALIMRMADIFLAFPYILFAILLLAIIPAEARQSIWPVVFTIGFLGWPSIARVLRSSILSVLQNDYIDAGRAIGASDVRLMTRHIIPNAIAPIIVYATMSVGGAILTEAALSFLGLGIQPPIPTWGRMIEEGRAYITSNPMLVVWPGLAILSTVLAFTLLGDGVRDALDVKLKD